MRVAKRRAGQNIYELAFNRRLKAVYSFILAIALLVGAVVLPGMAQSFMTTLLRTPVSPSIQTNWVEQAQAIRLFCLGFAVLSGLNGWYLWVRGGDAIQGAKGEGAIAAELEELSCEGWRIEYGLQLPGGGDVDVLCTSPRKQVYVIDVKSHKGHVTVSGKRLSRRMGKEKKPFEKDFIAALFHQVEQVKRLKRVHRATPILAFSAASVSIPNGQLKSVRIVGKGQLISLLRDLG
jgi:Nuclease-related domain